jgi:hypothetical protein
LNGFEYSDSFSFLISLKIKLVTDHSAHNCLEE